MLAVIDGKLYLYLTQFFSIQIDYKIGTKPSHESECMFDWDVTVKEKFIFFSCEVLVFL